VLVPQTGSEGDGRMTGKLALNFKPDADNLLFVFAARGYKNGGINPPGGSFRPETVWDYEAGWKSSFFDRRLKTQIGAFYMKYNNFQMDVINPLSGQSGVVNLANSDIKGFEASFQGKFDALSIDGGLSFVDSSLSALSLVNKWAIPAGVSLPQCTQPAPPARWARVASTMSSPAPRAGRTSTARSGPGTCRRPIASIWAACARSRRAWAMPTSARSGPIRPTRLRPT
jgi:iron complex outermembrane receptor protein